MKKFLIVAIILASLATISISAAEQLDIDLVACTNPCDTYSTAFVLSDSPVEIRAFNNISAMIIGEVETPSGAIWQLQFFHDTAYLNLEEPGNYGIHINASKDGYDSVEKEMQITVLDKLPKVTSEVICNGDGGCNGEETNQNCPQDCLPSEQGSKAPRPEEPVAPASWKNQTGVQSTPANGGSIDWILIAIIMVLLVMVLVVYNSRRKK